MPATSVGNSVIVSRFDNFLIELVSEIGNGLASLERDMPALVRFKRNNAHIEYRVAAADTGKIKQFES